MQCCWCLPTSRICRMLWMLQRSLTNLASTPFANATGLSYHILAIFKLSPNHFFLNCLSLSFFPPGISRVPAQPPEKVCTRVWTGSPTTLPPRSIVNPIIPHFHHSIMRCLTHILSFPFQRKLIISSSRRHSCMSLEESYKELHISCPTHFFFLTPKVFFVTYLWTCLAVPSFAQ